MESPTPEELVRILRSELERTRGRDYARACLIEAGKVGWFYVCYPRRVGNRWESQPISKPMRRPQIIALIEQLKTEPSKRRAFWKGRY